jgi:hypothetical protein
MDLAFKIHPEKINFLTGNERVIARATYSQDILPKSTRAPEEEERTVKFEVFTAVTMKNGVFWDVTQCGSCKNRRFGETGASFIRVTGISELRTTLAVTSNRGTLRRNTK